MCIHLSREAYERISAAANEGVEARWRVWAEESRREEFRRYNTIDAHLYRLPA